MRTPPSTEPEPKSEPFRPALHRRLRAKLAAKAKELRASLRRDFTQRPLPDELRAAWSVPSERVLSADDVKHFREEGYLKGLRILDPAGVAFVQDNFKRMCVDVGLPNPGPNDRMPNLQMWHRHSDWIYRLCTHTRILDAVEQLLGPDVVLWGSEFYVKFAGDRDIVPWHQDGAFWECALQPIQALTAFLPFFDVDRENGCLQVIPRTHASAEWALLRYPEDGDVVFPQEISDTEYDPSKAVECNLAAGHIMFHHPALLHMSAPNLSNRLKAVLAIRFGTPAMKADLVRWPDYLQTLVRGQDRYRNNPELAPPRRGHNRVPPRPQRYKPLDPPSEERRRKIGPLFITAEDARA